MSETPSSAGAGTVLRDEALCLRIHPQSNTSRLVLWFAREHGRLATVIRGSQRPKSFFLGQYDTFYTCELLYYARDRAGVHPVRECHPRHIRRGLRTDWRSCAVASYLCDLVARTIPADAGLPGGFELVETALDALQAGRPRGVVLAWFELHWLDLLGYRPRLNDCACGRPLPRPTRHTHAFSPARGGLLCAGCGERDMETVELTPASLELLRTWQACDSLEEAVAGRCGREPWRRAERALGGFLRHHANLALPSRDHALEILWSASSVPAAEPAPPGLAIRPAGR